MNALPFRQIHLDFHTSEAITPIATDFDAAEFAATLKKAHVESVTCFAKCHHGLLYYDSRQFPEAKHPGLKFDLLAAQVAACHEAGIQVPIYISVGFDEFMARRHPEWLEVDSQGKRVGAAPLEAAWHKFCFNTPYIDYVEAQTREVLTLFPDTDGIFYDIISQGPCLCPACLEGMLAAGLEPEREADRRAFANRVRERTLARLTAAIRSLQPRCRVFYNAGHVGPGIRSSLANYTHLELESLPSGGWGYEHFPITARFARHLGYEFLGMTGKFHKSWADFGSLKNRAALEYECFTVLSLGGKCSIGDQLHPRGRLDAATYDLIGAVYASVEAKEPWCVGARPVTEIAVFTPEALGWAEDRIDGALAGAYRMLEEAHYQFEVVDGEDDWQAYKVVILPDKITLTASLAAKVQEYLAGGGKILATYESGLRAAPGAAEGFREEAPAFALPEWGVKYGGEAPFAQEFVTPGPELAAGIPALEHIIYERGLAVQPLAGTTVLAEVWEPYFDRTWRHFCSHFQTPVARRSERPALTQAAGGKVIYAAYPFFGLYHRHGSRVYKQLILNALRLLLPDTERLVQTEAPTTAHFALNYQDEAATGGKERLILHILHYIPERRARGLDTIEDIIPLYNLPVTLRASLPAGEARDTGDVEDGEVAERKVGRRPTRVYLAPSGEEIPYQWVNGQIKLTVPEVRGHALVVCEW